MMVPFPEGLVEGVFRQLCREYGLQCAQISDREVLLISPTYAIYFSTEPNENGINVWYLDIPDPPRSAMANYDLGIFLGLRRPVAAGSKLAFASEEERLHAGLNRILDHLREKAQDVLRGEKDWLSEYELSWVIYPVESRVQTAIRHVLKRAH